MPKKLIGRQGGVVGSHWGSQLAGTDIAGPKTRTEARQNSCMYACIHVYQHNTSTAGQGVSLLDTGFHAGTKDGL